MPANAKHYVDQAALEYFLGKLKTAYENGTFSVKYATHAVGDPDSIKNTYATKTALEGYVPKDRTIAGLTLEADRSVANVNDALGTITDIKLKGNGDAQATSLTKTNHSVTIDISDYALKSEVAKVMDYKGSKTADQLAAIKAGTITADMNGDVYTCSTESSQSGATDFKAGFEYVAVVSGTSTLTLDWVELGKNFAGLASETWVSTNYVSKESYNDDQEIISGRIDRIYTPASGTEGEDDYVAAHGLLVDETNRATVAEGLLDGRLDTLEGADTVTGSVAQKIKTAIEGLYVSEVGGSGKILTTISETDGEISATAVDAVTTIPAGNTAASTTVPPTAAAVKSYVDTAVEGVATTVSGLYLEQVGASGKYIKLVSQLNGQVSATAADFDPTIGPASGNGAATNNTAPTSLAVRTLVNNTTVFDAITGSGDNLATAGNPIQAMVPLTTTEVDAVFTAVTTG